jgi:poly-gamma-glutamate capsule biosynthesis protein CapA/YwtB (metallophosphatase superfamily)
VQLVYSLGNFLFDQRSEQVSGALLEVTLFDQGTFFSRLIPLPNFYKGCRASGAVVDAHGRPACQFFAGCWGPAVRRAVADSA